MDRRLRGVSGARRRIAGSGLVVCVVASSAGCAVEPAVEPGADSVAFDLATARFVDLTHAFDASTVYWPTATTRFTLDTLAWGQTPGGYFYSAFAVSTPEHGGTHLDAPIHFAAEGDHTDEVPLDRLIVPAVVIDVSRQASADADYVLSPADVEAWEAEHGRIPAGAAVLLRTGWSSRWPDVAAYLGDDTPGDASRLRFPSFGEAAARLLVEERNVAALGADVASIDNGQSTDFVVHRVAMARNVPGFENLANLGQLPETGAWIIALPMKIAGGSGGPLRAVAAIPADAGS
ncbi:MAG TPA: cyclase family protein [Longimicrobiales bacterium]|nr:cyclase family protein [Longimicrobiales bacterium]